MKKKKIVLISSISTLFLVVIIILSIFIFNSSRYYKYNGKIYEDSYDYKNKYGYQYLEKTDGRLAKIYEDVYLMATDFSHKNQDVDKKERDTLFFEESFNTTTFTERDFYRVYSYFNADNPKFYWFASFVDEDRTTGSFGIHKTYIKGKSRKKFNKIVDEGVKKVDELVEGLENEYDIIKTLNDYIVSNMHYAYDHGIIASDEEWAHNIIGFFDKNSGVCETYTKVFKLFCDRYNIGNIALYSESHIWNIALCDGFWYVFDLTFDEGQYTYFGMTESYLDDGDHEHDEVLYELPENMAKAPLSLGLIELKENGKTICSSHSIDYILSKLNDGNYEIILNDTDTKVTNFYIDELNSKYNALTINTTQDEKNKVRIIFDKDISLTKDLTLKNMTLYGKNDMKIKTNEATLYVKDIYLSSVELEGNIQYLDE